MVSKPRLKLDRIAEWMPGECLATLDAVIPSLHNGNTVSLTQWIERS